MAFDLGFNFRNTVGYVTDGPEGVPGLFEAYPHTYTNGNGYSINAGLVSGWANTSNRSSSNDARIAGIMYASNNGGAGVWQIDLGSGSAPGAGTYTIDMAWGDAIGGEKQSFKVQDTDTVLIDGTNGGAGIVTATGHYIDATLADVAASTGWTGATASKTFATTLVKIVGGINILTDLTTLAHFRLTLQAAGGSAVRRRLTLLGVGS